MTKKFYLLATVVFVLLAQAGIAQASVRIFHTATGGVQPHRIELNGDGVLWILDSNSNPLQEGGKPIRLWLDESNPAFFALVYNTLKDFMLKKGSTDECYVFTSAYSSSTHGEYAKITQIQVR